MNISVLCCAQSGDLTAPVLAPGERFLSGVLSLRSPHNSAMDSVVETESRHPAAMGDEEEAGHADRRCTMNSDGRDVPGEADTVGRSESGTAACSVAADVSTSRPWSADDEAHAEGCSGGREAEDTLNNSVATEEAAAARQPRMPCAGVPPCAPLLQRLPSPIRDSLAAQLERGGEHRDPLLNEPGESGCDDPWLQQQAETPTAPTDAAAAELLLSPTTEEVLNVPASVSVTAQQSGYERALAPSHLSETVCGGAAAFAPAADQHTSEEGPPAVQPAAAAVPPKQEHQPPPVPRFTIRIPVAAVNLAVPAAAGPAPPCSEPVRTAEQALRAEASQADQTHAAGRSGDDSWGARAPRTERVGRRSFRAATVRLRPAQRLLSQRLLPDVHGSLSCTLLH